jgi:hypothetical protein
MAGIATSVRQQLSKRFVLDWLMDNRPYRRQIHGHTGRGTWIALPLDGRRSAHSKDKQQL